MVPSFLKFPVVVPGMAKQLMHSKSGGNCACLCIKVNKLSFMSTCMSSSGKWFVLLPNGISSSKEKKWMHQKEKTTTNVNVPAHQSDLILLAQMMGMRNQQCIPSMKVMHWTKGKGKGNSAIFLALFRLTIPREYSWKTRERIGGATGTTPFLWFSTMSRWIHCKTTSTLSFTLSKNLRLFASMPTVSMISKDSGITSGGVATCCNAEQ
mmetsp:Transcript_464/g.870  ORF Transcript_464/g.870 Transcript_464/m.870 type:complete len:209 (+) Transcript_464:308-934(+)